MSGNKGSTPSLNIDWEVYAQALVSSDMNDKEKEEYIKIIWMFICDFVDMGFGIHSVQHICGEGKSKTDPEIEDVIALLEVKAKKEFNDAVKAKLVPKPKRRNSCSRKLKK